MKINNLILIIILIIVGFITTYIIMPEGKVVSYRPSNSTNGRFSGNGLRIDVVVENGFDYSIDCNALSLKECIIMCDSLNKQIK